MEKKGISGITIIIIMIALILIAVISSLILLETGFTLEQKAIATSDRASKHLSNKLIIDEVGSSFDSRGTLSDFTITLQPLPSSERLDLSNLDLVVQTNNESIVLRYRANGTKIKGNTGYSTWGVEEIGFLNRTEPYLLDVDYDDDGMDDYLEMDSIGRFIFNFSSARPYTLNQVDCLGPRKLGYIDLIVDSDEIGSIYFKGYCGDFSLDSNVTFKVVPKQYGRGYFSVEYLSLVERDHIPGKISKGDILKMYFESIEPIGLSSEITLVLDPADGIVTEKRIYVPTNARVGNIFFD